MCHYFIVTCYNVTIPTPCRRENVEKNTYILSENNCQFACIIQEKVVPLHWIIQCDFGLRLGIEMSSFSALALHQSCSAFRKALVSQANDTRYDGQRNM